MRSGSLLQHQDLSILKSVRYLLIIIQCDSHRLIWCLNLDYIKITIFTSIETSTILMRLNALVWVSVQTCSLMMNWTVPMFWISLQLFLMLASVIWSQLDRLNVCSPVQWVDIELIFASVNKNPVDLMIVVDIDMMLESVMIWYQHL